MKEHSEKVWDESTGARTRAVGFSGAACPFFVARERLRWLPRFVRWSSPPAACSFYVRRTTVPKSVQ
eukprot:5940963-Pleurochrysis_carterae.AAC.3